MKIIALIIILIISNNAFAKKALNCNKDMGLITKFIARTTKDICIPLKENVPTVINVNRNAGTITSAYRITKKKNGYVAEINAIFTDINTALDNNEGSKKIYDSRVVENFRIRANQLHQENSKKVQKCLDMYAPYLRGPSGEKLTIQIAADDRIKPVYIGVDRAIERASYKQYSTELNCPTILHEVLHLLGLADEYEEKQKGYILDPQTGVHVLTNEKTDKMAFNCRTKGAPNSIMNAEREAVLSAVPMKIYNETTCMCAMNLKSCRDLIDEKGESLRKQKTCPKGFNSKSENVAYANDVTLSKLLDAKFSDAPIVVTPTSVDFTLDIDLKNVKGTLGGESLLLPAHFRAITNPSCYIDNKNYLECAKYAYVSSIDYKDKRCPPKPAECESGEWLE